MVCGVAQLLCSHAGGTAARTAHHTVDGFVDGAVVDQLCVGTRGEKRRFVEHVGEVGARETGGAHSDLMQVHVRHKRLALGVHLQNRLTSGKVRRFHCNLAVESTGAQQGGIEHIGTVRGGNHDEARVVLETIHLNEQLVEGLLALVHATVGAVATAATHCINLIDEDDGRGVLLRFVEQVTHAGGAEAHEHLHEVRASHRIERHACLACDCTRQQRLAGSRRAIQQHATRDASADLLVFRRILEEVLDFFDFLHCSVFAGHVFEAGLGRVALAQLAGIRLATEQCTSGAALHTAEQPPECEEDDDERYERCDQVFDDAVAGRNLGRIAVLEVRVLHIVDHFLALSEDVVELHALAIVVVLAVAVGLLEVVLQVKRHQIAAAVNLRIGSLAILEQLQAVLGVDQLRSAHAGSLESHNDEHDDRDDPHPRVAPPWRLALAVAVLAGILAIVVVIVQTGERVETVGFLTAAVLVAGRSRSRRIRHACVSLL